MAKPTDELAPVVPEVMTNAFWVVFQVTAALRAVPMMVAALANEVAALSEMLAAVLFVPSTATVREPLRAKAADDTADARGEQSAADLLGHANVSTTKRHYLRRGKIVGPTK